MSTGQTDMAAMPTASVAVDSILSNLKDRFSHHVIYTNIGPRILVAVNPWKQVPANASRNSAFDLDCVAAAATAAKAATSAGVSTKPGSLTISTGGQLPPHIFEMASGAYMHMISTGEDQVVIFRYVVDPPLDS